MYMLNNTEGFQSDYDLFTHFSMKHALLNNIMYFKLMPGLVSGVINTWTNHSLYPQILHVCVCVCVCVHQRCNRVGSTGLRFLQVIWVWPASKFIQMWPRLDHLRINWLIWQCLCVTMCYSFFVSHSYLLSVSKHAATLIYQSVRVHNSTVAGLRRATPHFIILCSIINCYCKSHSLFSLAISTLYLKCTVYSYIVSCKYIHTVCKRYTQSYAHLSCLAATCKLT